MKKLFFLLLAYLSLACSIQANQKIFGKDSTIIEFSGMVLTSDSLFPISYIYVFEKNSRMGTRTDRNGFFAFTAQKGDTIVFKGIEYQLSYYIIPDSLKKNKYNIIKLLTADTNFLQPVIIYPLPPRVQFDYIFVRTEIPDDDFEKARKNLQNEFLRQEALTGKQDAKAAYSQAMRANVNALYWKGQLPPNYLLNPNAWAQFFNAWKRGDYKKKKAE